MKKVFIQSIAFILVCVFVSTAYADDFQLRNGIFFGDSLETIKQKETFTIQSGSEESTNKVWFDGGTIGGMPGDVRYDFNEEKDSLIDMLYAFDSKSEKDSVDSDYTKLQSSLTRKYGQPLGNRNGKLFIITGPAIEYAALLISLWRMIDGDGDFRDYDEWIVDCDGYKVKIDLVSYYYRTKGYEYSYQNLISYHYYTDEDYLNAIKEKQDENNALDNDL